LQSFSAANLRNPTNSWAGPFLAKGATITMGVVDEPYLMGTPDVSVFCARLIYHGFTFAEAAYASQGVLSWQVTAIGDPLYRPFGKPAQQLHVELEQKKSKLIEWSYLRVANLNLVKNMPTRDVVNYLAQVEATRTSAVLTEKLADIYAAQGKPASALDFYQRALERDPSPQQRIRLRLVVADRLTEEGRDKDLYDNLWKLAAEAPDYAGRFTVMKKILDLAIKSGDKTEITRSVNLMQGYVPDE
jgi:tetratricopeptide (TPR) repeat protein